jgi:hypothetical protein
MRAARKGSRILTSGSLAQDGHDVAIASYLGVLQRRLAVPVGDPRIGTGLDEGPHRLHVAPSAIPEDHRLDQGSSNQVVDVVERCAGADELANDAVMAEMGRGDQRGAVINAGD